MTTYDPRTGPTQPPLTPAGIVPKALALPALRAGVNREGAQSDPLSLSCTLPGVTEEGRFWQNQQRKKADWEGRSAAPNAPAGILFLSPNRAGRYPRGCFLCPAPHRGTRGRTEGNGSALIDWGRRQHDRGPPQRERPPMPGRHEPVDRRRKYARQRRLKHPACSRHPENRLRPHARPSFARS